MEQEDWYKKTKDTLSLFGDDVELYNKSALFNTIIQQMARDVSVYDIVKQLVRLNEDMRKSLEYHIIHSPVPVNLNKDI